MSQKDQVLSTLFEESNKTFGMKSKPRVDDPNMFQLLQWEDKSIEQPWDFKKKNIHPVKEAEAKKYHLRIAHDQDRFKSEKQDQFRKIQRLPNGSLVQVLENGHLKTIEQALSGERHPQPPREGVIPTEVVSENDYKQSALYDPKIQSMYRDQYQVKDIRSHGDLLHQIEENSKDFRAKHKANQLGPYPGYEDPEQQGQGDDDNDEDYLSEELEDNEIPEDALDYQKRMNTKFSRKARKLDPNNPEDMERLKRRKERIKKMNATTRWLPNTAFTTYFGKPAWGPYGYGNVNPNVGGIVYGQHMLSHNVQPHRYKKQPLYPQSYNNALRFSQNAPEIIPEPPRNCKEEDRLNPQQVEALKQRNQLTVIPFADIRKTITDSKGKSHLNDLTIKKPDLINSLRFASEEGSVSEPIIAKQPGPGKKSNENVKPKPKTAMSKDGKKREQSAQPKAKENIKYNGKNENGVKAEIAQPQAVTQGDKKSKKSVGFKGDKQTQSDKKPEIKDDLTLIDRSQVKFMDELKRKKEKANKLTQKVNQVNPNSLTTQPSGKTIEQPRQVNKELQDVQNIDDMNPPHLYLSQLDQSELNPKYYKHIPPEWMHRIPYAGMKKEKSIAAKDCLDFGQ